jgi:hypothetical protein
VGAIPSVPASSFMACRGTALTVVTTSILQTDHLIARQCSFYSWSIHALGRAMAQVVSRRPLTAEARARVRVNPCGICGGQSGTGTGFSPSSSVFPFQYIIPPSLSKLISSGECVIF